VGKLVLECLHSGFYCR